jgi:hypothetical protein
MARLAVWGLVGVATCATLALVAWNGLEAAGWTP